MSWQAKTSDNAPPKLQRVYLPLTWIMRLLLEAQAYWQRNVRIRLNVIRKARTETWYVAKLRRKSDAYNETGDMAPSQAGCKVISRIQAESIIPAFLNRLAQMSLIFRALGVSQTIKLVHSPAGDACASDAAPQ